MDTQPVKWWNGQSETTRRLGCGLAVCGTVVGALYMIVQTTPSDRAMRFIDETGRLAISGTRPVQLLAMNELQGAIDASPAKPLTSVPIPLPSPLAAMIKNSAAAKRAAVHFDTAKTKVALAGDVEHFDRCLPQCETRDPLIAGHPEYAEAAPSPEIDDAPVAVEERVGFHPLEGARHLLNTAVDAPGMMWRRSRQAIDRMDW